jgi:hypothetical protein
MFLVSGETNKLNQRSGACNYRCAPRAFSFSIQTNTRSNISEVITNPSPNPTLSANTFTNPIEPKAKIPASTKELVNRLIDDTVVSEVMHKY